MMAGVCEKVFGEAATTRTNLLNVGAYLEGFPGSTPPG